MHKPVFVLGEYWSEQAEREGKPFAGPDESLLMGLLKQSGIDPRECHFTSVFNRRPSGNRVEAFCGPKANGIPDYRPIFAGKYVRAEFQPELDRLAAELDRARPNVVLALGNTALWAMSKKSGIKKYRGSPLPSHCNRWKVLPTWSMSSVMRQWELRVIVLADFSKARAESFSPELERPRRYIYLEPSLSDIEDFYHEYLVHSPFVSCDIETKQGTITEVGYATADGRRAIVIPFYSRAATDGNYWDTLSDERRAWRWVRRINAEKPLIGQNFAYDMNYFWRTVGIPCPRFLGDTMLLHHSLQPEMEKGLGFLGSIYTNEPSWKFMRTDHDQLKKGDE